MNHFYVSIVIFALLSSCGLMMLTTGVKPWKKMFVVVALVAAGTLSYRAMNMMYGYPGLLQNDYEDTVIIAYWPDKATNTMYLWIKDDAHADPISYKMPYSVKLHKSLEDARQATCGQPYRSKVSSKNYPLERFSESVDDVEVEPLQAYPLKEVTE